MLLLNSCQTHENELVNEYEYESDYEFDLPENNDFSDEDLITDNFDSNNFNFLKENKIQKKETPKEEKVTKNSDNRVIQKTRRYKKIEEEKYLWWVGLNHQPEKSLVRLELITLGSPDFEIFQEFNKKQQPELVIRYYETKTRKKIKRNIITNDFNIPIINIRTRTTADNKYSDVILTFKEEVKGSYFADQGNILIDFKIKQQTSKNVDIKQEPDGKAKILYNKNIKPKRKHGSDKGLNKQTRNTKRIEKNKKYDKTSNDSNHVTMKKTTYKYQDKSKHPPKIISKRSITLKHISQENDFFNDNVNNTQEYEQNNAQDNNEQYNQNNNFNNENNSQYNQNNEFNDNDQYDDFNNNQQYDDFNNNQQYDDFNNNQQYNDFNNNEQYNEFNDNDQYNQNNELNNTNDEIENNFFDENNLFNNNNNKVDERENQFNKPETRPNEKSKFLNNDTQNTKEIEPIKGNKITQKENSYPLISMSFKEASLRDVINTLAEENNVNFVFPSEVGQKKVTLNLKQIPWDEALQALLESHNLGITTTKGNIIRIDSLKTLEEERKKLEITKKTHSLFIPTKVLIIRLSYAKADEVITIVESLLTSSEYDKRVKVQADGRTNSIIVEATPNDLSKIKTLIERIDLQTPQVKIETRVIEITKNVDRFLGINWGAPFRLDQSRGLGFGTMVFPSNMNSRFAIDTGALSNASNGLFDVHFGSLNNLVELDLKLRISELSNYSKNLQNNSVIVLDNQKAVIEAGQEDYFEVAQGGTQQGQQPTMSLETVEYNLKLEVLPHITVDGSISMDLTVEASNPKDRNLDAKVSKSVRKLTTKLLRKSGETAVIGGLYTTQYRESSRGIPYLSKLPLVGAIFRSKGYTEDKRELMIMVTPTILNTGKFIKPLSRNNNSDFNNNLKNYNANQNTKLKLFNNNSNFQINDNLQNNEMKIFNNDNANNYDNNLENMQNNNNNNNNNTFNENNFMNDNYQNSDNFNDTNDNNENLNQNYENY